MHLGYDSRDIEGDPIGSDPFAFSSNPWLKAGSVEFASSLPEGLEPPAVLLSHEGGTFGGLERPVEIPHDPSQAVGEGTWAFSFVAYNPGNGQDQALLSKDHSGYQDGGHLTAWIAGNGTLKVRFQSDEGSTFLHDSGVKIASMEEHHLAFTFAEDEIRLYLDGERVDSAEGFAGGMTGNAEDLVLGASTRVRKGEDDNLQWHFDGEIGNLLLLDRPIEDVEAVFLSEAGGDIGGLDALYGIEGGPADGATGPAETDVPDRGDDAPVASDSEPAGAAEETESSDETGEPEADDPETDGEASTEDATTDTAGSGNGEPENAESGEAETGAASGDETGEDAAGDVPDVGEPAEPDETGNAEAAGDGMAEGGDPAPVGDEGGIIEDGGDDGQSAPEGPSAGGSTDGEEEEYSSLVERMISVFLRIFGLGPDDDTPDAPEVVEDRLDEVDTLLDDLLSTMVEPEPEPDAYGMLEEDEEDMLV
jgi:hypothetical protein